MKVTTQSELDQALATKSFTDILIDSPSGVWLSIGATGTNNVTVGSTARIRRVDSGGTVKWVYSGGTVERVYSGGTVEWVDSGGTVEWVDSGGTVERVYSGGTVKRVDSGGTVERVYSGGTVEWVDSGGTVKWVDSGGTVEWVDSGGTVERVYSGGTVKRVDSGGTVERVYSGGTVEWVDSGGTVKWVDSGGTVEWVDSGGTVERVYSGGTVKRVDSGGTVERVDSGGTVEWVDSGGTVERVYSGGTVERVDSGGTVQRAVGASAVHLHGGELTHAGSSVAVFLHTANCKVEGGTIIDISAIDLDQTQQWADFHGVEISEGRMVLYKAVNDELESPRRFAYPIGETVVAPDWEPGNSCGNGLHLSPSPLDAQFYNASATKFLRLSVAVEDVCPINDGGAPKVKVRAAEVLVEVDRFGVELVSVTP